MSLIVGVVVTLVAALVPALRATRVTPMAALREAELQDRSRAAARSRSWRWWSGLAGLAMMLVGLFGGIEDSGTAAGLLGGGAALILFGVSLFSPRLVRPLASLTGRPLERLRGLTGRLARENAMRKPGRTATTAAALMIGLALVVFVTIFAAGAQDVGREDDRRELPRRDRAPEHRRLLADPARGASTRAGEVDGVDTVSSITYATGALPNGGKNVRVAAVDPATLGSVLALTSRAATRRCWRAWARTTRSWTTTSLATRASKVGDTLRLRTPLERTGNLQGASARSRASSTCSARRSWTRAPRAQFGRLQPSLALARLAPDASPKQVQDAMDADAEAATFPTVEVQNQSQLKDQQEQQVNSLLGLVYALLSLAVIVSLFGIVNTLALSIHERTRELGMLRAVGMSRRQVRHDGPLRGGDHGADRRHPRHGAGRDLRGARVAAAGRRGLQALVSGRHADLLLVLAALAGVVAAIGPARRASRLDVLRALAYE